MGNEGFGFLDRFGMSRTLARWARALQMPGLLPARDLATLHADMVKTRDRIDTLASRAQIELQLRGNADEGIDRPEQCDWAARAAPWRQKLAPRGQLRPASPHPVGSGMTLFHDAANPDLLLRQDPAPPDLRGPLFALVFEVYRFDGSVISLVQDLPESAIQGLTRHHVLSVDLRMTREHPIEVYARLNVQHGPNQEQIVRHPFGRPAPGPADPPQPQIRLIPFKGIGVHPPQTVPRRHRRRGRGQEGHGYDGLLDHRPCPGLTSRSSIAVAGSRCICAMTF